MEERNNGGGGGSRGSQTPPTQLSLLYLRLPGMADRRQRVGAYSNPYAAPCPALLLLGLWLLLLDEVLMPVLLSLRVLVVWVLRDW